MKWTIVNFSHETRANCYRDDGYICNCLQPKGAEKGDTISLIGEEIFSVIIVVTKVKRIGQLKILRCKELK